MWCRQMHLCTYTHSAVHVFLLGNFSECSSEQSILLYNAETWTLKQEHRRKLEISEMSVLQTSLLRDGMWILKKGLDTKLCIVKIIQ